jgi:putative ABC transport system substrate-binding protein
MKRREFITLLGGATALPFAAHAQSSVPLIGYLASSSAAAPSGPIEAVHLALKQSGYEVGQASRMEYRYAENHPERLPSLAAELVRMSPQLIITSGGPAATLAAKGATATIPIVFAPLSDPVRSGVVTSLNKPGGNITGVAALTIELDPKRLELLHELTPAKGPLGVLFNPTRPDSQLQIDPIRATARTFERELVLAPASAIDELDTAFVTFRKAAIAGLLVAADAFFSGQRKRVLALVSDAGWPAVFQWREFAEEGGLASFGSNLFESYRQAGLYAARILGGEKPANLPVEQPTKFELVINLKTARALGVSVPLALQARADGLIE